MLLAFDCGNTQITIGLYDGAKLAHGFRLETVHSRTADEYGLLVLGLLGLRQIDRRAVTGVAIASVVPALTRTLQDLAHRIFEVEPLTVGPGVRTGMKILYDSPRDVGADRIVNAVAAYDRYKSACIVVDFGTATTFDSITAAGEYAGGAIAPGIQISMDALFRRAAKLPRVDIGKPESVVGKSTQESMQSGIYYGYAGLVDGLVRRMRAEMGPGPLKVIATGGLAPVIVPATHEVDETDPDLTLEGLRLIWGLNKSP